MNKQRQHRRIWSQQEDEVLRTLVEQSADPDKPKWKEISDQLNSALELQLERNSKQCRERWYNSLAQSQRETKQWDIEDDVKLIEACKKHGHRWSKLSKQFDHKVNDNRLKNHFYSTLRKIVRVINSIVKQSKKQYQNLLKTSNLEGYTCEQLEVMKEVSKLRSFQAKLLSKVFSLIDDKQQYKYQAKCSLEVEEVKSLNDQILDYMHDYVTNNNQFSNYRILAMIAKIMHVNRTIKTKYVREVKLSIIDEQQIQKAQEIKKKREKKINNIVKEELDNKIIPDRKTKAQIISKIKDQNKKLKKLMTPIQKKRKKEKKNEIQSDNDIIEDQNQDNISQQSEGMINYMQSQEKQRKEQMFQQNQDKQYNDQCGLKQQEYDKVSCLLNLSQNHVDQCPQPANGLLNSDMIKSNNFDQNKQKNLHSPSFNFSSLLNQNNFHAFNNPSQAYDEWDKNSKTINQKKELPLEQQTKKETKNITAQEENKSKQSIVNQNPFTSNFLNDIPLFTSNNSLNELTKKVQQPQQDFRQLMNPFFPEHKLNHSQGYFIFDPPQPEPVENHQNDELFKSNPILGSFNFLEPKISEEQHMNEGQSGSNKNLRNSRIFQGLFASYNYQSNNDKGSEQSERMKNSLFDLIPNFHPMHTSAFCPLFVQNAKQNQEGPIRGMEASRPFSANNLNDHQFGIRYNLMESQPIYMQMCRSSELLPDSNHSGFSPYRSYSYGQLSQQNRSTQSKSKKNE